MTKRRGSKKPPTPRYTFLRLRGKLGKTIMDPEPLAKHLADNIEPFVDDTRQATPRKIDLTTVALPSPSLPGSKMHEAVDRFFEAYPHLKVYHTSEDPGTLEPATGYAALAAPSEDALPTPLIYDCFDCSFLSFSMTDAQEHMIDTLSTARTIKVGNGHTLDVRFATEEEMSSTP